jgi:hypothetical protein
MENRHKHSFMDVLVMFMDNQVLIMEKLARLPARLEHRGPALTLDASLDGARRVQWGRSGLVGEQERSYFRICMFLQNVQCSLIWKIRPGLWKISAGFWKIKKFMENKCILWKLSATYGK